MGPFPDALLPGLDCIEQEVVKYSQESINSDRSLTAVDRAGAARTSRRFQQSRHTKRTSVAILRLRKEQGTTLALALAISDVTCHSLPG